MIRPGGLRSATTSALVIHPPPGASTMFPILLSSSVSSRSLVRKYGSPFSANSSDTVACSRFSSSRSRSMKTRPSRSATCWPTVDFPAPEIPTRMRCGPMESVAQTGREPRDVAIIVALELLEGVAAELLEGRLGDDERHHRLGDHPHCGDGRDIAPLSNCLRGSACRDIDRFQRPHQGADGLHRNAQHQ